MAGGAGNAMNPYSEGLRHGYEDAYKAVQKILDYDDMSDARKLELIAQQVESTPYAKREEIEVPS